ncbi:hypothetical protein C1645_823216 [Glomus cerebriforme]|uniref:Uncharacterized protein n=1 Tax=Glomus cerebriforme TaxID=658196 RepID=A0A397SAG5_9GLOM|nr:hypothetical protein C1645_794563 [Glomus cerebriforme]RIA90510.1 hypothetical protein C1645_823216 [Glomus cerebriforme]
MAFNVFGKNSGNKDSLPATNPKVLPSSILGAAGFAFKSNNPGIKSLTTEKIFHNTKPLNLEIDEGSDSSENDDDESTDSDSSNDSTRVEQVKSKSNIQNKKTKLLNNVNDIQDDKSSSTTYKKPHATNIISDFSNFEFHSKLRALGGRVGNENYAQSEISSRNKKSELNNFNTVKSDFVSGPTANLQRIKVNKMLPTEEQSYNRSDIRSDVSWGSDPGQQQQPLPQVKNPTVKVNPNFIIEHQNFIPNIAKLPPHVNNVPSYHHHTNTNDWNTKSSDSRSEIMYRGKDKMVSSRHNTVIRNPRFNSNSSPGIPKTMSDVTYQPKELRTEVPHYNNPEYYGGNSYQRKPSVQVSARIPYSVDESTPLYTGSRVINQHQQQQQQHKPRVFVEPQRKVASFAQLNKEDEEIDDNIVPIEEEKDEEIDEEPDEEIEELINMTEDTDIQRKLLELHLSNKELLSLNKTLEENINEQSSELENLSSFDSLLKTQKEQLEHITNLENIIKDLTTKLSEQETQIKEIKDDSNEENKKARVTLFYDPRNLPLHTLPRIIFDRVYDDVTILYTVIKSLLYTFYIFPILIFFRVTRKVYEKSKTKFMEISAE